MTEFADGSDDPKKHKQFSLVRRIPGFRSGKPWKMAIAGIGYFFILMFFIGLFAGNNNESGTTSKQQSADTTPVSIQEPTLEPEPEPVTVVSTTPSPESTPAGAVSTAPTPPAPKPSPTPVSQGNLGVSVQDFVPDFKKVGFSFEQSTPVRGQPRVMGTSSDGLAILELIGPSNDLLHVSMIIGIPNDRPDVVLMNVVYLGSFLKKAMPEWEGSIDWLTAAIDKLPASDKVSTTRGSTQVTLQNYGMLGMVILTVKVP